MSFEGSNLYLEIFFEALFDRAVCCIWIVLKQLLVARFGHLWHARRELLVVLVLQLVSCD